MKAEATVTEEAEQTALAKVHGGKIKGSKLEREQGMMAYARWRKTRFWIGLLLLLIVCGCNAVRPQVSVPEASNDEDVIADPAIDSGLGERRYPNEAQIAEEISGVIEKSLRAEYSPGNARRDAHPKAHGCVRAELHVGEAIPTRLAKGIFVPGKTYQALIRFSNGSRDPTRADIKRDARGLAIKILGVPGTKLMEDERATQDFIMINHPVFFANDPDSYLAFMKHVTSDSVFGKLLIPFSLGAQGTLIALETASSRISNPVQTRYWTMVPYQLGTGDGREAVKYSARSCSATVDPMPKNPGHDFLRDALRNQLLAGDACMELLVQPRTSDSMNVEDSMTEWMEEKAPFYQVATIRIPSQVFDTPEQNRRCENLSYNPWHSLPEHRPLGVINRMRKVIYEHISRVRHEMNSTVAEEPQ